MVEKRNITKADIFLKARILSEGVRIEVKKHPDKGIVRPIVLDGCDLVTALPVNPYSRLEVTVDGEDVIISDMDKLLGTAKLEVRPDWLDIPMSNGLPAESALPGKSATIINIILNYSCHNYNTGKGCKYCGLFANPESRGLANLPQKTIRQIAEQQAEAVKIGIDHGWRGTLVLSGGALPPSRRDKLSDLIDTVMAPLRKSLDDEILSTLHIAANVYPPKDFSEMEKWKEAGVNSTEIDLEVMDPAYFRAICPGKSEAYSHEYWKEAQIASTEIFGPGRGTVNAVVVGIEPMTSLVEGIEERISKGVFTTPLNFMPTPGSPYAEFRPPTAQWQVEACEKMADSYFRHADKLDGDLIADDRAGFTRTGRSFFIMLLADEITRRAQEMGKFPPGLPKQDAQE